MDEVPTIFPIMFGDNSREIAAMRKAGCCFGVVCIPWALIAPHEKQSLANHSQTLAELASRGGLSACEALAVLEDRRWRQMAAPDSHGQLAALIIRIATWPATPARPDREVGL